MTRVDRIRQLLTERLQPQRLEVEDESHLHVGHAGARDGRGHFRVALVSEVFRDKPSLARHRAVYAALGEMMQTDIHALSVEAKSPEES